MAHFLLDVADIPEANCQYAADRPLVRSEALFEAGVGRAGGQSARENLDRVAGLMPI